MTSKIVYQKGENLTKNYTTRGLTSPLVTKIQTFFYFLICQPVLLLVYIILAQLYQTGFCR